MWKHAKKDMDPFRMQRYYSIRRVIKSAEELKANLTGDFDHYIPYRLGEEAYQMITEELDRFLHLTSSLRTIGVKRLRCSTIARDPKTGKERGRLIRG
jgi:1-acyl-sn-glycerol-3-phosphate acyltransferase